LIAFSKNGKELEKMNFRRLCKNYEQLVQQNALQKYSAVYVLFLVLAGIV